MNSEIGMNINREAIFDTRPWEMFGDPSKQKHILKRN